MSAISPFELTAHLGTLQHSPVGPAGPASIERVQGIHCICGFPFACGVQGGMLKGKELLGSIPHIQNPKRVVFWDVFSFLLVLWLFFSWGHKLKIDLFTQGREYG